MILLIITSDFVNGQEILDIKAKNEFLRLISYDSTIFSWSPRVNRIEISFSEILMIVIILLSLI